MELTRTHRLTWSDISPGLGPSVGHDREMEESYVVEMEQKRYE